MTDSAPLALTTPLSRADVAPLRAGQRVLLSGVVYTARDAAHRRLSEALAAGHTLPMPLEGQVVYYVGPAPARPGEVIGPAGPTTAGRVDLYTPALLAHGLRGMIGKGKRSAAVRQAIVQYGAVYFVMVGGAAALIAQCIKRADLLAYADLGTEAIYRLEVQALPMLVADDPQGGDLFEQGQAQWRQGLAVT
jgi:fumarate hydratase subunit beta